MTEPLVSVIIPLYNTDKFIENAVNSVINQTYKNWQLIIIDDCSTDKSLEIAMNIRKEKNFLHNKMVIKRMKKNMGTYIALNVGLKLAKGKYFCILGSDDTYTPDKLELQVTMLEKNPKYMTCVGKYIRKDLDGEYIEDFAINGENTKTGVKGECTCMYKISIINEIGYYDSVRYGGDTNFIHRVTKFYSDYSFIELNKILYIAIERPNRLTKKSTSTNRIQYFNTFMRWLKQGNYFIPFPLQTRPYKVPPEMLP
jgi:glycosyltransferase involved in cell wall biosynthesis